MPRAVKIVAPALVVLAAVVAAVASLVFGGGADAPLVLDPGPIVNYGLPLAKLVVNLAGGITVGALVLACFAVRSQSPELGRAVDVASASAGIWTVSAGAAAFFTFIAAYNQPVTFDSQFGDVLARFLTTVELGQAWLYTTLIAAVVTVLCFAVRNHTALVFVAALAVAGLIPMALQGHRGGTAEHDTATSATIVHLLFAAIWLGGLVTIVLIAPLISRERTVAILTRYSTLALIAFVVVAASGYVSALVRVDTLENLATRYGVLVLAKLGLLLVLGGFGALWRRYAIARFARSGPKWFWWLITAELGFMGLASGVAAALARTATPVPETTAAELADPTPAELLTGRALPPPMSAETLLTLWNVDLIWVLICAFGIFFYLAGVWRLHWRGDRWPVHRTILWVTGMLLLAYVTNGGINVYERYLFSAHMLAHMVLGMVIPVLLVPGAPITLALRAIRKRDDGSRGAREWILLAVHSRYFAVLSNPIVAAVIFAGSLLVFYYTPIFSWATTNHIGHEWMIVHFLFAGFLFVQTMIGVDPMPRRAPYPMRLIILLATMAFHAFFGLAILSGTGLMLADWYGAMGWPDGLSAIADQQVGGGIAWSVGEIPTVALAILVAVMWSRSDARESKRYDRKADRDGDAELNAYNAMLAERARRN